jgi:hypothetical protein
VAEAFKETFKEARGKETSAVGGHYQRIGEDTANWEE